jgi:hypothetical protein
MTAFITTSRRSKVAAANPRSMSWRDSQSTASLYCSEPGESSATARNAA